MDPRADSFAVSLQAVSGQANQGAVVQNPLHVPEQQGPQQHQCLQPSAQNSCMEPWHRRESVCPTIVSTGRHQYEDGVVVHGSKSDEDVPQFEYVVTVFAMEPKIGICKIQWKLNSSRTPDIIIPSGLDFGLGPVRIKGSAKQTDFPPSDANISSTGAGVTDLNHSNELVSSNTCLPSAGNVVPPLTEDERYIFNSARMLLHGPSAKQPQSLPDVEHCKASAAKKQRTDECIANSTAGRPVASPMGLSHVPSNVVTFADGTVAHVDELRDFTEDELAAVKETLAARDRARCVGSSSSSASMHAEIQLQVPAEPEYAFLVTEQGGDAPDAPVPISAQIVDDAATENSATLAKALKNCKPFIHEVLYMEMLQKTFDHQEPNWVIEIFQLGDTDAQRQALEKRINPKLLRKMKLWWGIGEDLHPYLYEMLIDRRYWHMPSELFLDRMMQEMWLTNKMKVSDGIKGRNNAHWVVVLGCSGICVGLLCLQKVVEMLRKMYMPHFCPQILEVWLYEILPAANKVANLVLKIFDPKVRIVFKGDIEHFPADVDELLLFPDNVKYIMLGSTECNNVSFANASKLPAGTSGLHGSKSRTYFPWHRGLKKLSDATSPTRMVVMSELPQVKCKVDAILMNKHLGKAFEIEATDWNHASRHRCIRSSPVVKGDVVKPMYVQPDPAKPFLNDGTKWHPAPEAFKPNEKASPVTLRRYWPRLIVRSSIEGDKNLSAYERLSLASLRVYHPSGEVRFAGVEFFLEHLGLASTVLSGIKEMFECEGTIDNFGRKLPGDKGGVSCGARRLCGKCDAALQLLGGCWHLPSCTEALAQIMFPAVLWWQGYPQVNQPTFWEFKEEGHVCDETCKQRPPQ